MKIGITSSWSQYFMEMLRNTSQSRFAKRATPSRVNDIAATWMDWPSISNSEKNLKSVLVQPPSKPVQISRESRGNFAVLRIKSDRSEISRMSSFGKMVRTLMSSRGTYGATSTPTYYSQEGSSLSSVEELRSRSFSIVDASYNASLIDVLDGRTTVFLGVKSLVCVNAHSSISCSNFFIYCRKTFIYISDPTKIAH